MVRDYALETLGDEDAVQVIDETGFLKQGKASPVNWLGGQDHQLPDRSLRLLCVAAWPCLHRPGALPAKGMDGRTRSPEGRACPGSAVESNDPSRMVRGVTSAKKSST